MTKILIKTASGAIFLLQSVTLPFNSNVRCRGDSFFVNISLDVSNNFVVTDCLTGRIIVPATVVPQGSSKVFVSNGTAYTFYNLSDTAVIDRSEGSSADVYPPPNLPPGQWDRSSWDNFSWS